MHTWSGLYIICVCVGVFVFEPWLLPSCQKPANPDEKKVNVISIVGVKLLNQLAANVILFTVQIQHI